MGRQVLQALSFSLQVLLQAPLDLPVFHQLLGNDQADIEHAFLVWLHYVIVSASLENLLQIGGPIAGGTDQDHRPADFGANGRTKIRPYPANKGP